MSILGNFPRKSDYVGQNVCMSRVMKLGHCLSRVHFTNHVIIVSRGFQPITLILFVVLSNVTQK